MSAGTFRVLKERFENQKRKDWRYEDMMVGCELNSVGVYPTDIKAYHWKRPWQRQKVYGVLGPLVLVHKIKDDVCMRDLRAWTDFVLTNT